MGAAAATLAARGGAARNPAWILTLQPVDKFVHSSRLRIVFPCCAAADLPRPVVGTDQKTIIYNVLQHFLGKPTEEMRLSLWNELSVHKQAL
jgi:hypothetical protein